MPQNPAFVRRAEAAHVSRLAQEYGLEIHLPERLLNSSVALCAVEIARDLEERSLADEGATALLHRSLFEAYYRDRRDISDSDVVLKTARQRGISCDMEDHLRAGDYRTHVAASRAAAHAMGVVAVPTWLSGGYGVVGVPELSDLVRLVETAAAATP